jgi:hypothetical protein
MSDHIGEANIMVASPPLPGPTGSVVACWKCGCLGNCSCGHEPLDRERCCTLDAAEICPCCRASKPKTVRVTMGYTSWDMELPPNEQAEP